MSTNPYLLTLPQLISAKKKLGTVAAHYDPKFYSMTGFEAEHLSPSQFREQLRRNFFITLTDAELGALVTLFDTDKIGKVTAIEFVKEFFRIGKQEKMKIDLTHRQVVEKIESRRLQQQEERLKKFTELAHVKVATTWTEEHQKSVLEKIAKLSAFYDDHNHELERFQEQTTFSGGELRGLLRINFLLQLSPEETGALVEYIGPEPSGRINCKKFVNTFLRLGRERREKHDQRQNALNYARTKQEQARIEDIQERYAKMVIAKTKPASEDEQKSAYEKIRKVAIAYKVDSMFGNIRQGFESASVTPTAFRELLKANFAITLSPGELDAVVKMFDILGTGEISSSAFLNTIGRINGEERSRNIEWRNERNRRVLEEQEAHDRRIVENMLLHSQTKVVWPVLPEIYDEDSFLNAQDRPSTASVADNSTIGMSSFERPASRKLSRKKSSQLDPLPGRTGSVKSNRSVSPGFSSAEDRSSVSAGGLSENGFEGNLPELNESSIGTLTKTNSIRTSQKKKRKQGTQEIISPALIFAGGKNGGSFADLFPNASKNTKEFLQEIEAQEEAIKQMKYSSKKNSSRISGKSSSSVDSSQLASLQS